MIDRKVYQQNYHAEHQERWRTVYRKTQKAKIKNIIREAKDKPCMDCGIQYPYYVMQFDHRQDETKSFNIGMAASNRPGIVALLAEIEKCDVVCSNCHAERTHRRRLST